LPWDALERMESVNEMVETFTTSVNEALDVHAPFKSFTITSKYKPGLSEETLFDMNLRDEIYASERK